MNSKPATSVRPSDRVRIVGAHPWSGYAGRVESVDMLTGNSDNGITVLLDCGLRATVADSKYWQRDEKGGEDE